MNLYMDNFTYKRLISIAKTNRIEKCGYLLGSRQGQDFYVTSIELQSDETIELATKTSIDFNVKYYLSDLIFRMSSLENNNVLICFHTHPTLRGSVNLSKDDIQILKSIQELARRITNKKLSNCEITVIEGVVNWSEIAFYAINQNTGQIERQPLFVDGIEIIPADKKTFIQSVKDGFTIGRKKAKEKN